MFPSSSARPVPQEGPQMWANLLTNTAGLAEKRRKELYQEIFRAPRLIPEMARLGVATKEGPRSPRKELGGSPLLRFVRQQHKDEDEDDSMLEAARCAKQDWFEQRAPDEDELTDEEEPDVGGQMSREVQARLPLSPPSHKAERIARFLDKHARDSLLLIKLLQDHLHILVEHQTDHAVSIARFANSIPLTLALIFYRDSQGCRLTTLATIQRLQHIHRATDCTRDFGDFEPTHKQRLWDELQQTGEFLEEVHLTLRGMVEQVDLFEVKKEERMDRVMLEVMTEAHLAAVPRAHEYDESYGKLARFNYALSEVSEALVYYGALVRRAIRSVELWKALLFQPSLDLPLLASWSHYWSHVLTASAQAFQSLESHFDIL